MIWLTVFLLWWILYRGYQRERTWSAEASSNGTQWKYGAFVFILIFFCKHWFNVKSFFQSWFAWKKNNQKKNQCFHWRFHLTNDSDKIKLTLIVVFICLFCLLFLLKGTYKLKKMYFKLLSIYWMFHTNHICMNFACMEWI